VCSSDLAGLALYFLDSKDVVGGDLVLLAAGFDDCEHERLFFEELWQNQRGRRV
jgi:hypothetical protein